VIVTARDHSQLPPNLAARSYVISLGTTTSPRVAAIG
jgi:hypothetical protein